MQYKFIKLIIIMIFASSTSTIIASTFTEECYTQNLGETNTIDTNPAVPMFEIKYNYNLNEAYRVDKRKPEEISRAGFFGTNYEHPIRTFGNKTVFSAADIAGVEKFYNFLKARYPENKYYLYKINTQGLKTLSFEENMLPDSSGFLNLIAENMLIKRNTKLSNLVNYYNGYKRVQSAGCENMYSLIVRSDNGWSPYVDIREIHIEGPILPDRISYVREM
jgi:hypothetical protein